MRRLVLSAVAAVITVISAQSYDYGIDAEGIVRRQDSSARILVGKLPLAPNGSTPVRPELRDMRKDQYAWNLYILAQSMLQYVAQDNPLSWYQITGKYLTVFNGGFRRLILDTGIHGVPFEPWNGVQAEPGASQSGYCSHSSILFPMWHRPYLALYEVRKATTLTRQSLLAWADCS